MSDRKIGVTAKQLIDAKAVISDPKNWCQNAYWTDNATRFCAIGILCYPLGNLSSPISVGQASEFLSRAALSISPTTGSITYINDKLGHAAVMKLYDLAINMALNEGK